jgi:hypothetical protein
MLKDRSRFYEVCERQCSQCLFSPNRIVSVERMQELLRITQRRADETDFECHKGTLAGRRIVCRGFYDTYPDHSQRMQVAGRLGLVRFVPVPGEESPDGTR